ncbi:MAG: hypothetical protein OEY86_07865 [Nitrospira sp.]|nr:hypothetical protein [Nitrospira sp.]
MEKAAMRIVYMATAVIVLATAAWASSGTFVTVQSLIADLESRNIRRIDRSLNDIKTMPFKGQILPFVADLWEQRKDKHPGLPWDVIDSEVVRVELADILLQSWKNKLVKLDPEPMHRYLLGLITRQDPDVARIAIVALSAVDDEADVEGIHQVAKQKEPATFRVAIISLSRMCNQKAAKAIAELEESIAEPQFKSFIVKRKQFSEEFRKRSTWCNPARSNVESK